MAARAMWSGSVTFGMVTLPVKLYTATDDGKSIGFSMICREHEAPVNMPRVCSAEGERLAAADIVKGYQAGDTMVLLEPEDLSDLPLSTTKELRLDEFVPAAQVLDPLLVKATYNVGPDKVGRRAFAMLRDALYRSGRAGVGKVALRGGREQLAALTSDGTNLRLVLLHWADDIRDASEIAAAAADEAVSEAEVAMGVALIETLAGDFDLTARHDEYAAAMMTVIEAKVAGVAVPKAAPAPKQVGSDLMAALAASLAAAKAKVAA